MTARAGRGLRAGVLALMGAGLVLPIGAGLWQTAATAFGRLPAADDTGGASSTRGRGFGRSRGCSPRSPVALDWPGGDDAFPLPSPLP